MQPIENSIVANVFATYPPNMRRKLLVLRRLILDVAASIAAVGEIEETLKWGEPAYLTTNSKSGSTIRIGWNQGNPSQYAMYFNCRTNLVETFRMLFPDDFRFVGNRSIVFDEDDVLPADALEFCIATELTYHLDKMKKGCGGA